jgi:hypothetical protein
MKTKTVCKIFTPLAVLAAAIFAYSTLPDGRALTKAERMNSYGLVTNDGPCTEPADTQMCKEISWGLTEGTKCDPQEDKVECVKVAGKKIATTIIKKQASLSKIKCAAYEWKCLLAPADPKNPNAARKRYWQRIVLDPDTEGIGVDGRCGSRTVALSEDAPRCKPKPAE